jgi:hypothetical protein
MMLGRTGEVLSCPDCEHRFREYLIFRSAVVRFANLLDDLEIERRRIREENRPPEVPPLQRAKALFCSKAGSDLEQGLGTLTATP